ncbi:MAG: acetyl-CoA carboxylase biotin carboxyl carrier protein [Fibrobacterota bacterium]|nr:MAG: acetyl-CoA carboxylase biotin carboxyl carrier protein [Fibrobacterota bacterium]
MNVDEIGRLIELLDKSSLSELQWSGEGERLLLKKPGPAVVQVAAAPVQLSTQAAPIAAPVAAAAVSAEKPAPPVAVESGLVEIKSPMVGTFYRSASPDSPVFVDEGARVDKGKTVCIIEAMKLMNEIESEVSGTVVKVCVANETPVEFGTVLFLIRPA